MPYCQDSNCQSCNPPPRPQTVAVVKNGHAALGAAIAYAQVGVSNLNRIEETDDGEIVLILDDGTRVMADNAVRLP